MTKEGNFYIDNVTMTNVFLWGIQNNGLFIMNNIDAAQYI